MDKEKNLEHITELEREIASLPIGTISIKNIKGKEYYYHRYSINKKRIEKYIDFKEVETLKADIEKRKKIENELKTLKKSLSVPKKVIYKKDNHTYKTYVRTGEYLRNWALSAKDYVRRECYTVLNDYVFNEETNKVFILYGLRRTGKTTLIRQIILNMNIEQLNKSAFIQVNSKDDLSSINKDLKYLESQGFKYIFIDEVTLMKDFIEGAALFSDIYVSSGMKIVLSGTDSLGFVFTEHNELYDRCTMLHTTFIPYRDFENVLHIKGIDEYIHYGGTMSMGGIHYNESSLFADEKRVDEYIDSAIAHNIQHALEHYEDGGHFRKLFDLYKNSELTSAINRVVDDLNHRFTTQVLTKTFKSNVLSSANRNLLRDKSHPLDLKENIDEQFVLDSIKKILDILEKDEQNVEVDDCYALEIKEYLLLLDMISEIDLYHFPNITSKNKKIIISQPGLRYAQTEALISSLLLDNKFEKLSIYERNYVIDRVMDTIRGRMMEDIVLLETKTSKNKMNVFQLQFAVGEFDMVIQDPIKQTCEIYEIKHSKEIIAEQYHNLVDKEMCKLTEHRFGAITKRSIIYRGENKIVDGIYYLNVEEYLKSLTI